MTHATLVELKLASRDGKVERKIICTNRITVFNLHKVIQFCLFPSKGDDTVAGTVSVTAPKHLRQHNCRHCTWIGGTLSVVLLCTPIDTTLS